MLTKRTAVSRLSPAWQFMLLSGELPGATPDSCGLPGWAGQADDGVKDADGNFDYSGRGDLLWDEHGAALTAEAAENHFVPYWLTGAAPAGHAFQQWRAAFLQQHGRVS